MGCKLAFYVSPKVLSVTNYSFASVFRQAKARKHAKTVFQVIFKIWDKIIENQVFDFEFFY